MTTDQFGALLSALRRSHERLAGTVGPLTAEQVTGRSYDDEWSIAQVLSHLGSGADIFGLILDAGLGGEPAPGPEQFQPVWDRWNGKSPQDQARDGVAADAAFLDRLAALDPSQRASWRLTFFGAERDLNDMARMRLSEHALHTWDVAVMLDGTQTIPADAAELMLETVTGLAARIGKPSGQELRVHVTTHQPAGSFRLHIGPDEVSLAPAGQEPAEGDATLRLPAEAFIRLLAGRLDEGHTPAVEAEGADLDDLRQVFPGF